MARGDISIIKGAGPAVEFRTEANSTAIYAGEPVKLKAAGSPYAIACEDGDLTIGTDTVFLGIAASDSSHSASADGVVLVYMDTATTVLRAKAKTYSTVDTQSEINALCGDRVVLDLTSSTWTIDAAAGDNSANAFYILGGDPVRGTLDVSCRLDSAYAAQ